MIMIYCSLDHYAGSFVRRNMLYFDLMNNRLKYNGKQIYIKSDAEEKPRWNLLIIVFIVFQV